MSGPLQWSPAGMIAISTTEDAHVPTGFDADAPTPALPRSAPPSPRPPPASKAITPRDVLRLARARLREVEAELKRIRRLEAERDELKRLLDAASNKPRAVVRELPKRSAG